MFWDVDLVSTLGDGQKSEEKVLWKVRCKKACLEMSISGMILCRTCWEENNGVTEDKNVHENVRIIRPNKNFRLVDDIRVFLFGIAV